MSLNIFCKGLLKELVDDGYDVVALSTPDKDLKELGEREGVKTIGVNMERHVSPWKDFISLVRLIKVLRKEKPDMVHSMTPKAGLLCMVAAWWANVPLRVHTFTGLVWPTTEGLMRQILILTDKLTCACATHIIPEGEGVKSDLERCITKKPMRVLGFGNVKGIDLNDWKREREKQSHSDDSLIFVFVGRIVRDKGLNELVPAFVRLHDLYPKVKLILVGPYEENLDPIMPRTKNLIDECEAIESVGSQKDVRPFYEMSDVFVFPSYREGFPNVVIEAGAMDLPSIVTDINGSREIIEEGKNGLIVPPRDEDALFGAMKWMVEHPDERRRLVENARPMVASRFEQGFVRQCLLDYYQEIFSEK
ncbi:MAG: glycosyltransferase family 4 protein [Bacteroidaceae bacterium]|nr:glycosyltransferase family 4 protein [Bacteroidaceae bacterium]